MAVALAESGFSGNLPQTGRPPLLDTQYCHVAGGKLTIFTVNAAPNRELRLARHVAVGVGQAQSTIKPVSQPIASLRENSGERMIRIFEDATPRRADWLRLAAKTAASSFATAAACALLGFLYLCVAFPAGEFPGPMPVIVIALLFLLAAGVAALGCFSVGRGRPFPWLVVVLTPLILGAVFSLLGDHDSSFGFTLGGMASAVFLVGALGGRGIRYWIRVRKNDLGANRAQN